MDQDSVRVPDQPLREFVQKVFVQLGMSPEDAAIEAEVLVWANLRGVDSHGVQLIAMYADWVDNGHMNPRPRIQVQQETAATVLIEADRAFGPVVTTFAMEQVMSKAREVGIGWGLIRNTTHQGAMGYYVQMAAKQNMAGIALVCNPPNMAPTGARVAGVHNSPIAIGVPGNDHAPLIFDMATSVAAGGKVQVAIDKEVPIPEDWALDADGNPTTDPKQATTLLPAGGYKGYGLSLMFECLSSLMVGNPLLGLALQDRDSVRTGTQNSVVAAIDIGTFTGVEEYKENIDTLVGGLKGLPKTEGTDEIFVPGEPEDRVFEDRSQHGVPLPPGTVQKLRNTAAKFDIELPPELQ